MSGAAHGTQLLAAAENNQGQDGQGDTGDTHEVTNLRDKRKARPDFKKK